MYQTKWQLSEFTAAPYADRRISHRALQTINYSVFTEHPKQGYSITYSLRYLQAYVMPVRAKSSRPNVADKTHFSQLKNINIH